MIVLVLLLMRCNFFNLGQNKCRLVIRIKLLSAIRCLLGVFKLMWRGRSWRVWLWSALANWRALKK